MEESTGQSVAMPGSDGSFQEPSSLARPLFDFLALLPYAYISLLRQTYAALVRVAQHPDRKMLPFTSEPLTVLTECGCSREVAETLLSTLHALRCLFPREADELEDGRPERVLLVSTPTVLHRLYQAPILLSREECEAIAALPTIKSTPEETPHIPDVEAARGEEADIASWDEVDEGGSEKKPDGKAWDEVTFSACLATLRADADSDLKVSLPLLLIEYVLGAHGIPTERAREFLNRIVEKGFGFLPKAHYQVLQLQGEVHIGHPSVEEAARIVLSDDEKPAKTPGKNQSGARAKAAFEKAAIVEANPAYRWGRFSAALLAECMAALQGKADAEGYIANPMPVLTPVMQKHLVHPFRWQSVLKTLARTNGITVSDQSRNVQLRIPPAAAHER